MITEGNVNPNDICIITFTRKAADELKYRIKILLPEVTLGFVGTFHSLAIKLKNKRGS